MKLADLPATLTVSNAGDLTVGIAHINVPARSSVTLNLGLMGVACRCDVWLAVHAARLSGLVTTSPATVALTGKWNSAHNYKPPSGSSDSAGHDDVAPQEGTYSFAPDRRILPRPTRALTGPRIDLRAPGNSQYAPILTQI